MRILVAIAALALSGAAARAETIQPSEAPAHVGSRVTVEGVVSRVHRDARSGATFIDLGLSAAGKGFTAVIFSADAAKFTDVAALNGKTVQVTGAVRLYKGKPEVILKDAGQIAAR
ncbi:MAG TPA: hypothetical protein VFA53_10310 [Xanthobacteraceae bacterium]|nr:hypothetical protein [Xanthobacteraceae bacterium]